MIGLRIQIQGSTTKGIRYLVDFPLGDGSGEGATRCRSVQRQRVLLHVDRGGALLKYGINGADWGTGIYRAIQLIIPLYPEKNDSPPKDLSHRPLVRWTLMEYSLNSRPNFELRPILNYNCACTRAVRQGEKNRLRTTIRFPALNALYLDHYTH